MPLHRRRAPLWVRDMSSREIHGICFRLNHERREDVLSDPQEWLWDACVSELEYRRRQARWPDHRCSCELCIDPFDPQLSDGSSDAE